MAVLKLDIEAVEQAPTINPPLAEARNARNMCVREEGDSSFFSQCLIL